jgi:hypothetical protein
MARFQTCLGKPGPFVVSGWAKDFSPSGLARPGPSKGEARGSPVMLTDRARRVPLPGSQPHPASRPRIYARSLSLSASRPRIDDSARTLISSPLLDLRIAAVSRCLLCPLCLDSVARRAPPPCLDIYTYLFLPVLFGV